LAVKKGRVLDDDIDHAVDGMGMSLDVEQLNVGALRGACLFGQKADKQQKAGQQPPPILAE